MHKYHIYAPICGYAHQCALEKSGAWPSLVLMASMIIIVITIIIVISTMKVGKEAEILLATFGGAKTNESHVKILLDNELTVQCSAVIMIMIRKMTTAMTIMLMTMTMMMTPMMMMMMTGGGKARSEEFQLESDLSNHVD